MRTQRIPSRLRERVRALSPRRCAYCHSPEVLLGMRVEIDHIIPKAAGGATTLANLCLICSRCNRHKHNRTRALDPFTRRRVRLFHPETPEVSGALCVGRERRAHHQGRSFLLFVRPGCGLVYRSAAAKVFSIVFLCHMFGVSCNTFYRCRCLAAAGVEIFAKKWNRNPVEP